MPSDPAEIRAELSKLADLADEAVVLGDAALALAALARPERPRQPYRRFLDDLAREVGSVAGAADGDAATRAAALAEVLANRYRFAGDNRDYDELENANLMRVIDRRRGLPVSLGILYIQVGRDCGWPVHGLGFPLHFLVRVDGDDGGRVIVDPFDGGQRLDAAAMRALLKALGGNASELQPAHYAPVGNRDILLRLQNNVKFRQLRTARLAQALQTVEAVLLFAPGQSGLWREAGLMRMRLGDRPGAIAALEQFLARTTNTQARHRTSVLLQELRAHPH